MQVTLKVRRYDPDSARGTWFEEYRVDVESSTMVLDALIYIREFVDETLALRCSCRSAICGSCTMRVNHQARLSCKTKVLSLVSEDGVVEVEPMGNLPVIKDLVVDMKPFWDKVRGVEPWLQPVGPEPEREYLVPNAAMVELAGVMNCIMCGACVSDCTALEVDKNFLGPAALAKAYRFVEDPRDGEAKKRLEKLSEYSGVWDCTHCFYCVEVCPKGVAPMERILALRREAADAGFTDNNGSRHSDSFAKSVKKSGWLDEIRLSVQSFGLFNLPAQLRMLPVGLRALKGGKMPPLIHHKRRGAHQVKRIFEELGEGQK